MSLANETDRSVQNLQAILPVVPPKAKRMRKPVVKAPTIQPPVETKRQKFLRLGQPRVVNCLHSIRLIGNLASANYQWTPEDVALIRSTLNEAIEQMIGKFSVTSGPRLEDEFKFVSGHAA